MTPSRVPDITIVEVDDWQVLYVDGKKVAEGHRLRHDEIMSAVGIKIKRRWYEDEDLCDFPDSLDDLTKEWGEGK